MLHTNSLKRLVISKLVISVWHLHRITQVFSYFTCSSFLSVICIVLQSFLTRNSKIIISFQIPVVTFVNILQGSIYNIFFLFSVREERSNQPSHLHIVSHECILLLYKQTKKTISLAFYLSYCEFSVCILFAGTRIMHYKYIFQGVV